MFRRDVADKGDMDETGKIMAMTAWMRRNKRSFAVTVLGLWAAPPLFLAGVVVVMSAKEYPAFALSAALAVLWIVVRVLRRRRNARADQTQIQIQAEIQEA